MTCFVSRPSGITLVKFHSLQVALNFARNGNEAEQSRGRGPGIHITYIVQNTFQLWRVGRHVLILFSLEYQVCILAGNAFQLQRVGRHACLRFSSPRVLLFVIIGKCVSVVESRKGCYLHVQSALAEYCYLFLAECRTSQLWTVVARHASYLVQLSQGNTFCRKYGPTVESRKTFLSNPVQLSQTCPGLRVITMGVVSATLQTMILCYTFPNY